MEKETYALSVTIFLAIVGYAFKYLHDASVTRRKDRLDRINLQLRHLYGPLYSIKQASDIAYRAFRSRYRPGKHFFDMNPPPTELEFSARRLWILEVLMPMNLKMEKIIIENGDLIIENTMPKCLMDFCAHVASYKVVVRKWNESDFTENLALSLFPRGAFDKYIEDSYEFLKSEQAGLLGKLRLDARK